MFKKIFAIIFLATLLFGCKGNQKHTEWEPGDKIVAVEPYPTGPRSTRKSVWIIYRKSDGTTYRKVTSENTTDGTITVIPKDYHDGKTAYGIPSSKKTDVVGAN